MCNAGDPGLIPGSGRSSGGGHGNSLQYSCLENSMDRGAWWAIVHRVTKSWTQLNRLSMHASNSLCGASLMVQTVKNLPAMQETQILSLSQEDPLEKKMATHSSILWGQHYPNTNISQREILLYKEGKPQMNLRRQWHPTPVLLPGNSHGRRSLVGFSP